MSSLSPISPVFVPLSERGRRKKQSGLVTLTRRYVEIRNSGNVEVKREANEKPCVKEKKKKKKKKFRFDLVSGIRSNEEVVLKDDDFFDEPVSEPSYISETNNDQNNNDPRNKIDILNVTMMYGKDPLILQRYLIRVDKNPDERSLRNSVMFLCSEPEGHEGSLGLFCNLFERHVRECHDLKGCTPIHVAACKNSVECCKMLYNIGVDVFRRNKNGETALHVAAQNNAVDVLEFLASKKKSFETLVNSRDRNRRTALHHAILAGHSKCVWILCRSGAKPALRDVNGNDALSLSVVTDLAGIARILLEIGFWSNENEYFRSVTNALGQVLIYRSFRVRLAHLLLRYGADAFSSISKYVANPIAVCRFLSLNIKDHSKLECVVGLAQRLNAFESVVILLNSMPRCSRQLRMSLQNDWNRRYDLQFLYQPQIRPNNSLIWIIRHRVHVYLCSVILVTQAENVRCYSLLRLRVASYLWNVDWWKEWLSRMRRAGFRYFL
jgi:hypothetical protein